MSTLIVVTGGQVATYGFLRLTGLVTTWSAGLLLIGTAVSLSLLGTRALNRWYPPRRRSTEDHKVLVEAFSRISGLYAIVLGFTVVITWQQHSATQATVAKEASAIAGLIRTSRGFPIEVQRQAQDAARTYLKLVITEEWPLMAKGQTSVPAGAALAELWTAYTDIEAKQRGSSLYDRSLDLLNQISDGRRARLNASTATVPLLMWTLLYLGAIVTVTLTAMFVTGDRNLQLMSVATLAGVLMFVLFLAAALEQPFGADLTVTPKPFTLVLNDMPQLER